MEQIIEIFADAISGFILNSIQLQEQNAPPNQDLRKKADVVIMTSKELIRITRLIAQQDYSEYPDIQTPILDCVNQVERALDLLAETIEILFKETDRARGWKKLVDSTKTIGSQTSRLLVVIYGSEQKRLERAANAALLALEKIKKYSIMPENQLRPKLTDFVNEGGDCSSKIIQFATFVGGRSQTTKEEHDKEFLREGFNALNQNNNFMIEDINSILNNTASVEMRKNLAGTCNTLIDIINKIMGNEKSPEELDAFRIIEDLFNTANNALYTNSRGLDELDLRKKVDPRDIIELAKKAKQAISLVEQHNQRPPDDLINDTNISSNRVAQVSELIKIYNHQNAQPSLKDKMEIFIEKLDYGNGELVSKTNDFLSSQGNNDLKQSIRGSSVPNKDLSNEVEIVKNSIKDTIKATNQLKTSPGTQNFAPAARDLTNTIKQIISAGKEVVSKVNDPQKTVQLEQAISNVSDSIRAVIQNGKVVHQDPNNQNAQESFQGSISQLSQNMRAVLNETGKLNQPSESNNNNNNQISQNKPKQGGVSNESQYLTNVCQDLQQTLDNLIDELMPPFSSLHERQSPQSEKGSISMNKLRRLAEDAIAALEQVKPFRGYTPKETFNALEYALEAVDLFKDRLGNKANSIKLQALKEKMLNSKKKIDNDSNSLLKDTEGYISAPKEPQGKKVDKDIQDLIDEISRTMDAIQPSHISSTPGTYPFKGSVTPNDLKKQGEIVKKDCNETQKQDTKLPEQIKKDVEKTFDDTDTFVSMVEKLALDANSPGYKNFLNDSTAKLRKAQENMIKNANNLFDEPENPNHGKAINDECEKIKKLVDKIIEESTPRAKVSVISTQVSNCSPLDIEDAVKKMKEAVGKHDNEHTFMAPKELVGSAQDSSGKISNLASMLKQRAQKTENPELKKELMNAANLLEKGNSNLVDLTNKYLDDPSSKNSETLSNECQKLMSIADEILDKIKPKANKITHGSVSSNHNGSVTPKDIESLGQEVKKEVSKVQDYKKKSPTTLVGEAYVASSKGEQLADLLDKMASQADRPATKKKLQELAQKLREKNDKMIDDLNYFIENPDDPSTGKNLDSQCQDLKNFVDKIIDEVKPKVTVSKVEIGGEGLTPKDLFEAAKLAKTAINKLSNQHKTSKNEDLQKDAGDASTKLAKFTKLIDERSKKEKRPQVAQKLKNSTPELEKGNHKMVEATNTFISDPKDPSTSKEVVNTCGDICHKIDDIINELMPEIILTPSSAITNNFKGIKNDQLKTTLEEVRKAVQKVKGFPKDSPKDISNNTGDASKKVALFAKQLLGRVEDLGGKQGDLAKTLKKTIDDLENGNSELVKSAQNYLGDPDTPANAQDLDAACDILLQILDDVWDELVPTVEKKVFTSTVLSSPTDLENVGQQLKKAVTDVSHFDTKTPKQLVGSTEEASLLGDNFAQMLEKRAKETVHPELKNELLNAAKKIRSKNDDLVKDVQEYLSDPNNPNKQKKLTSDCDEIHKIVDDILDKVNPKLTPSTFGTSKVTNPSPDTIENAVREMIESLVEVKKKKKESPKKLVGATEDSSSKIVKTGDFIKAYAQVVNNPSLQRLCNDAFNELTDGHDRLIGTTNNFVKSPENQSTSQNLDDACDNLERIGRELISELKPELPDPEEEDFSHIEKVSIPMLKNAFALAQKDLEEARKLDKTPSQLSQATQKAGKSINKFKALAKIRAKDLQQDNREIDKLIEQLEKSNLGLHQKTRDYFGKPNDKNTEVNLKKQGEELDGLLRKVFESVKPSAKFTAPNFNKQRNVTLEEVEQLAQKIKDKLNNVDSYQSLDEDSLCDTSSGASSELATFAELVFMKANESGNPNITEAIKRNLLILPKEITTRNQNLVEKTNKYIEAPEEENTGKTLKLACKNIKISIDSALDLVREATPKKDFRDLVLQAAGDIERAAKEWDCDDEIVGAALSIAEEMKKLAEAARKMDRKEIILRARNISDLVKTQIISYAKPIQDNCNDKQLQKDVSTGVQALSNFSTQLKIMASVQAADLGMGAKSGKTNTAENQLIACCKGISTSMKATLKSTQSAKIKKK
eukprot:TRINITY_DN1112_c0_g1_i3.p1 TRINITY_DN1112_c0_g1~~TRINITY_DN1112_c0_g1_i3.p1  ORF type:complete len:2063 (+),score=880.31 TRINITY_DN1112_c0_g1_i3:100-6288(+)